MARTGPLLAVFAALLVAGCKDFDRPRDLRQKPRPDLPQYTIEEQQSRGRGRYAVPDDDFRVGPRTFTDRPSPTGR